MRKLVALRASVVGSTAMLLLIPFSSSNFITSVAGADPAPSASPAQLAVDQLPGELVEAIGRDLKISPAEYLNRAAKAQELGTYAREFRAERPESFAGAWMGQDGHPIVAVTSNEAAQIAARAGYQTRIAPISADGLERSLAELNRWISAMPREAATSVNSIAIDVLNSQLVVDIANSPAGHMLNLPTLLANVKVILSPGGGGANERTPMGGDTYVTARQALKDTPMAEIGVCSFGFNASDAAGRAINVTAGHCDPNAQGGGVNAPVFVPDPRDLDKSPEAGMFTHSTLGDPATGLDYALIELNSRAVRNGLDRPTVRGAGGTTLTITGTAAPVVGAPVCKSGQTSTFTCGVVAADRVETQLFTEDGTSRLVRGFASTACTLAGDSGGAIVTGTLALGITSGSNASTAPNCVEANLVLAPDGGTASLGIPIREIIANANSTGSASGLVIRTSQSPA
ncbi:trypsin-like serine protease [Antrihabitans sp. YC3-6]|uniref:Trypsin-like serine protease n=1 Tax=Antrihabitans stalagmiti TaxID=2799499 RepID=A0A934NQC6_9NOCA|nr:S1 family peptidase [Antrihabitans stalagmiti]MBJ8339478.1 trypsin-like serine protease [Antrihabitans stalagmiti]